MSTDQDAADVGPAEASLSDGNDRLKVAEEVLQNGERAGTGHGQNESLGESNRAVSEEEEEDNRTITANHHTFDDYVDLNQSEESGKEHNEEETSLQGLEEPSSADGSISVPDDLPSVQVRSLYIWAEEVC